jgi:hypothetical protein
MLKGLLVLGVIAAVAGGVIVSLPDLKRYMKIRSM